MNKAVIFGMFTALLGLMWMISVLVAGSNASVIELPYEAFQGLVFFFVWGLGFPIVLGIAVTGLCIAAVLLFGFTVGYQLWCWVFYNH
ncbi:MAG: hypothetical protein WBH20_03075 [Oceanisphaera sp.]|uniref:hypothetical protein n=1 Tax=Oceanisphaera sp. TaxID=1929979 RepID=UPI003C76CDBF